MPKPEKDKPFTVVISLDIKKDGLPYFRGESQYSNTGYATVVGVQQLLIGVLNRLGEAGVELAMEKGLEDELRVLGVLGTREKAEIVPKG